MPRPLSATIVALWLLTASPVALAQQSEVAGRALAPSGAPVAGATVTLQSLLGGEAQTTTDVDGRFSFAPVERGDYRLIAVATGLSPAVQLLSVPSGDGGDVMLVLPDIVRERVNVVGHAGNVDRIPGSAAIIGREELARAQIATDDIHQMLRQLPGVHVQEEDGYGLRPNIGMRGSGAERSSKITMMEDGVLVAPAPYAAPAAYYSPIAGRMEELEIRKGSSQIKYGPITTAGVLNYVSASIPSSLQVRATATGGGDRTGKVTASVGDSRDHVGWIFQTFQFQNDGFKRLDGGGGTGVGLEDYLGKFRVNSTPTPDGYHELEVKLGRTEQVGDETYLGLSDADFARTPLRRYAASQADRFESTHQQYQARYLLARQHWDLTTVAYRNDFSRAWYKLQSVLGGSLSGVLASPEGHAARMAVITGADSVPGALVVRDNNRRYYGAGVQSVLGLSLANGEARHQIEAGIRYHQDEEDRFQRDDRYQMSGGRMVLTSRGAPGSQDNRVNSASAVAGFVSDTVTWGRWTVAPGLRYETIDLERLDFLLTDPDRTGMPTVRSTTVDAVIPGVGLSYAATPGVSILGGVHRGFAPPGPGAAEGTEVEHSVNYEIGTRVRGAQASAELIGFFNDYGNLLGRDTLASGGAGEGDLFNGGSARIYGLEASAAWNPMPAGSTMQYPLRIAYTLTQAQFRSAFQSAFEPWGAVQRGDELPYVPRHNLYASIDADRGAWRARLEGYYSGRMRTRAGQGAWVAGQATDAYFVLNLSGEVALRDGVSVVAAVQNITDNSYIVGRHPAGVRPGLPRLAHVGLKLALGR